MNARDEMVQACAEALDTADSGSHWRGINSSVVDPRSVPELIALATANQNVISAEQRLARCKSVRDVNGATQLRRGEKVDPVRDNILLQSEKQRSESGR